MTTASAITNELSSRTQHGLRWCILSLAHSDTTIENDELATILTMETFREHMSTFVEMNRGRNTQFYFWWQYMQMVGVRLSFIRVQIDGI